MKKQQHMSGGGQQSKRLSAIVSPFERNLLIQLHYFQQFLETFPKTTQIKCIPYFEYLKSQNQFSQSFKQRVTKIQKRIGDKKQLPNNFKQARNIIKIYKTLIGSAQSTNKLIDYFQRLSDKIKQLQDSQQNQQNRTKYIKKHNLEYYPDKIDKTDSLGKQFEMSYRLSKMFGTHNLSHHDRKAKDPQFQIVPRFIYRLEELAHYQSNAEHLGNILSLTYEGNQVVGNKTYAVVDHNKIQLWEKRAGGPPEISLVVQNEEEKQNGDKIQEQAKQKQPVVKENRPNDQKFKLSQIFLGHTEKITSVSISYDQLYMLSTGMDKSIKLWCLRLKMLIAEFYGHTGTVWDVQWAPTGFYFLSGSSDKMAIFWKTDVPAPQRIFQHHGQIYKVNFLKNPDFACTAGQEGIFRIWKIITSQCIRQIIFPSQILNFDISFSGGYLGLYQTTGQVSVYDISKGQKINSFRILQGQNTTAFNHLKGQKSMKPHDISFSQDQKQLAIVTSKHIILYSMDQLGQKTSTNIYQLKEEKSEKKSQPPKEVIYMGRDVNLTYCNYTRKNLLVVGGTKRVVN